MKPFPMIFRFRSGSVTPASSRKKLFGRVYANDIQAEAFIVVKHVPEFVFAQHAVVDENAGEVFADGAIEQNSSDRRVDAAAQAEHHFVVSKFRLQVGNSGFNK